MNTTTTPLLEEMVQNLPEDVQDAFLSEVGSIVLDASLLRTMTEITDDQAVALEYYLKTNPDADELFAYLLKRCTGFAEIFAEELATLKQEMDAALVVA